MITPKKGLWMSLTKTHIVTTGPVVLTTKPFEIDGLIATTNAFQAVLAATWDTSQPITNIAVDVSYDGTNWYLGDTLNTVGGGPAPYLSRSQVVGAAGSRQGFTKLRIYTLEGSIALNQLQVVQVYQ
jgi:hypothetical protein